jgi:hypothetical protein
MRAAAPLRVTISNPVSTVDSPPSIEVAARNVLSVRGAVPYTATIYASLDGGDFVEVWTQRSGKGGGFRLDTRLGDTRRTGDHHVRVRAHLSFGTAGKSSWTETRELPDLLFAICARGAGSSPASRSLYGPATLRATDFDAALPAEKLEKWVAQVLEAYPHPDPVELTWVSHYCAQRTADPKAPTDSGSACAVMYFTTGSAIGQIWFKTAETEWREGRPRWAVLDTPRFEGLILGKRNADRLSALAELLQADPASGAGADVAILPVDIDVTRPPNGSPADVSISVRNNGPDHLFNAYLWVQFGSDLKTGMGSRRFVVTVPPFGTAVIRTALRLPAPYAWIMVQALQGTTEHGPQLGGDVDPTPEDACAIRLVNGNAAPPALLAEFRRPSLSSCQVLVR